MSLTLLRVAVASACLLICSTLEPPPDISHISVTPPPRDVCSTGKLPILGLVVVLSHPGNQDLRMFNRRVYPERDIEELGFRRVFVLAKLNNKTEPATTYRFITDLELKLEYDEYGDIVILNYTEAYKKLILKSYATFNWAVHNCSNARFILRADDDTFIDFFALTKHLLQVEGDDYVRGYFYDHFMAGPFYYTSPKALKRILAKANVTSPINPKRDEDDFFTGILADVANVKRMDEPAIRPWWSYGCCCYSKKVDVVYECQWSAFQIPTVNRGEPGNLYREEIGAMKIKEHSKFCYYFGCEKFRVPIVWKRDVSCFGFYKQASNGWC